MNIITRFHKLWFRLHGRFISREYQIAKYFICDNPHTIILGSKVKVGLSNQFYSKYGKIRLFDGVCTNNHVVLNASIGGKISIGPGSLIGPDVYITTSNHKYGKGIKILSSGHDIADVIIGENVWVGRGVTVLSGVEIGKNSVIAANSLVSKSVPENVLMGGIPARVIREI